MYFLSRLHRYSSPPTLTQAHTTTQRPAHEESPTWLPPILYHRTCANRSTAPGGRLGSRPRNPSVARSRRRLPHSHRRPRTFNGHPPPRSVPWTATEVIPRRLRLDRQLHPHSRLPGGGAKSKAVGHHGDHAGAAVPGNKEEERGRHKLAVLGGCSSSIHFDIIRYTPPPPSALLAFPKPNWVHFLAAYRILDNTRKHTNTRTHGRSHTRTRTHDEVRIENGLAHLNPAACCVWLHRISQSFQNQILRNERAREWQMHSSRAMSSFCHIWRQPHQTGHRV